MGSTVPASEMGTAGLGTPTPKLDIEVGIRAVKEPGTAAGSAGHQTRHQAWYHWKNLTGHCTRQHCGSTRLATATAGTEPDTVPSSTKLSSTELSLALCWAMQCWAPHMRHCTRLHCTRHNHSRCSCCTALGTVPQPTSQWALPLYTAPPSCSITPHHCTLPVPCCAKYLLCSLWGGAFVPLRALTLQVCPLSFCTHPVLPP